MDSSSSKDVSPTLLLAVFCCCCFLVIIIYSLITSLLLNKCCCFWRTELNTVVLSANQRLLWLLMPGRILPRHFLQKIPSSFLTPVYCTALRCYCIVQKTSYFGHTHTCEEQHHSKSKQFLEQCRCHQTRAVVGAHAWLFPYLRCEHNSCQGFSAGYGCKKHSLPTSCHADHPALQQAVGSKSRC